LTPSFAALAFVLAVFGVVVTFRAWDNMFRIARDDPEYQHIFLVPCVVIFLVWVRRHRLRYLRVSGTVLGPVLVLAGWGASIYGQQFKYEILFHLGAVIVLIGCLVSALGKQALFRFLPVAIVMLMIVPMPQRYRIQIADPLQRYTAEISSYLLDMMGVKTEVNGSMMVINNHPVMIAEACNGMRMVLPLLLIAFGFAFGLPLRTSVRVLIVAASPIVALVCNVLRVMPLVWLQGQSDLGRRWGNALHEHSGWIMVPLAFLVLLGLIRLLRWAMVPIWRFPLASQGA